MRLAVVKSWHDGTAVCLLFERSGGPVVKPIRCFLFSLFCCLSWRATVADDILDCTQTSEQLGKTAGKVGLRFVFRKCLVAELSFFVVVVLLLRLVLDS